MLTGAYAQGGHGGGGRRDGTAPALLSLALHAAALALLLNAPLPRPVEEEARHLLVELLPEAPPVASASGRAAAAPPVATPPVPSPPVQAPPVRRREAEARPAVTRRPAVLPPAGPPDAVEAAEGRGRIEAPVQAADHSPAPPSGEIQATSRPESDAAFRAYMMRLHDRIASHRVYPPQALRRREEGDVRLRVLLARDGRLLGILNLAEASLNLTEAARQAVSDAAPFDPPPKGDDGSQTLAFEVTVAFRLR